MSDNQAIITEKKGPYFVVNMTKRWKQRQIERGEKPTIVHRTLLGATTAAQRLAKAHPENNWAVFECIGYVTRTATLGGAPV